MSPLIVITGPTASGKTSLALEVALKFNGEIVCADSRTIYKGMDIGTAKPSMKEQLMVPHHLIDVVRPDEAFTVVDFKRLAIKAIEDIIRRGKLPILVGGTGLYVDSVIFDYQFGGKSDPDLRSELSKKSLEELRQICEEQHVELPENDKNRRYLMRAIERGSSVKSTRKLRPNTLVVAVTTDREELRLRVTNRAEEMIDKGVIDEVRRLGEQYGWASEVMKGNIYRSFRSVVEGASSVEDALELAITSDMQLAKRQLTWLKRNPYIIWGTPVQLFKAIEHFVQQNKLIESIPL